MSTPDVASGQRRYYDPVEVETYVKDVTNTIKALQVRLQEAVRRAERAEQHGEGSGDRQPETASLGRALLLAGEVAEKTIADADVRATEIIGRAEDQAAAVVEAAHVESRHLVDASRAMASEVFEKGEARLLAAVGAFIEGSNVLRAELAKIEDDATRWRRSIRPPERSDPPLDGRPAPPNHYFDPPSLVDASPLASGEAAVLSSRSPTAAPPTPAGRGTATSIPASDAAIWSPPPTPSASNQARSVPGPVQNVSGDPAAASPFTNVPDSGASNRRPPEAEAQGRVHKRAPSNGYRLDTGSNRADSPDREPPPRVVAPYQVTPPPLSTGSDDTQDDSTG